MEKRYTQSRDIYGKKIEDLYKEKTNKIEIYIRSKDIQKKKYKTYIKRGHIQSKNTYGEGYIK